MEETSTRGRMGAVGMLPKDLEPIMLGLGHPKYRASQVLEWIYSKMAGSYEQMTNLPAELKETLAKAAPIKPPNVMDVKRAKDGTTKLLIGFPDGANAETVLMEHDYGLSLCVSSQAGCKMGCAFCASAMSGYSRDLTSGEMCWQFIEASRIAKDRRISSVVIMGMGEPLMNYDAVLQFIRVLNWGKGFNIGARRITLSTCGIVPGIERLAGEDLQITLSISLHAPDDATRDRIMPVNKLYNVSEVVGAGKRYADRTGRRVTYEYVMIKGVNDSLSQAAALVKLLKGSLSHVNLIPLNPVPESGLTRSTDATVAAFKKVLEDAGLAVTSRREMGSNIEGACGQLRLKKRRSF